MGISPAEPRRLELWKRRLTDFTALAIVTCALMEFCADVLRIDDRVCVVVLAVACASDPVLQLLRSRRSATECVARRGTHVTAIVAAAPWILLGWLNAAFPSALAWGPPAIPAVMRYTGCALAIVVVLVRPIMERPDADRDDDVYVPSLTLPSQLLMVSLLLVSFSLTTAGLTLYWLAAAGIQRSVASASAVGALGQEATLDMGAA